MVAIKKKHAIESVENGEKLFTITASYSVFWVILLVIGIEIKQNFKSFSQKNLSNAVDRKSMKITQTLKINEAVHL